MCINTVYGVISWEEDFCVERLFFPVFILDLVDLLSKSQQMPAEPCCSITVPLYPHCLGPVTTRAVCAPNVRARNGERSERGEPSLTLSSLRYQGLQ